MTSDATGLGMFLIHAGIVLGILANLVIVIRGFRNGKDKR